jgi:tetratricopeptide (TPR) repeat protein
MAASVAVAWTLTPDDSRARIVSAICLGAFGMLLSSVTHGRGRRRQPERKYITPRDLPPPPSGFVGRERQIRDITAMVNDRLGRQADDRPFLALLLGPPGIGKTALALQVAHQVGSLFPEGQIFVRVAAWDTDQDDLTAIDNIFRRLSRALSRPDELIHDKVRQREEFERRARDRRLLIVLDDVPEHMDVSPILPSARATAVIITARQRPANLNPDYVDELTKLDEHEALNLLKNSIGADRVTNEHAPSETLVELCKQEPLALRLTGAALASRPSWSLSDVTDLVTRYTSELYGESVPDLVNTSLDLTYGFLTRQERLVLRCIPAIKRATFGDATLRAVLEGEVSEADVDPLVAGLIQALLIQPMSVGPAAVVQYEVPEAVAKYAAYRARNEDPEGFDEQRTYRLERKLALPRDPVARIRSEVYPLMRSGLLAEAITTVRHVLDQIAGTDKPDDQAEASGLAALAEIYLNLGENSLAEDAAQLAYHKGAADSKARALRCLAQLRRRSNSLDSALDYLNAAFKLTDNIGEIDERIRILTDTAVIRSQRGGDFAALDDIDEANHLCEENGRESQIPTIRLARGTVLFNFCQFENAAAELETGREMAEALGQTLLAGWTGQMQARIAIERHQLGEAADHLSRAIGAFVTQNYSYGLANCRYLYGQIELFRGDPALAAENLVTALKDLSKCGDPWLEARTAISLGIAYRRFDLRRARIIQLEALRACISLSDRAGARWAGAEVVRTGARSVQHALIPSRPARSS